jgi:NADPH:quinone reductase-like Zn-dependent oxidoreductase
MTTAKAIRFARTGGPEVLEYVDVEVSEPGPGEARVRNHAIGVNFIGTVGSNKKATHVINYNDEDVVQREAMLADLFQMVSSGQIVIDIHQRFPLADAAKAHIALEGRRTTGKTILLP